MVTNDGRHCVIVSVVSVSHCSSVSYSVVDSVASSMRGSGAVVLVIW